MFFPLPAGERVRERGFNQRKRSCSWKRLDLRRFITEECMKNRGRHVVSVVEDVAVPEPYDTEAGSVQVPRPTFVKPLTLLVMRIAVDLDDQFRP